MQIGTRPGKDRVRILLSVFTMLFILNAGCSKSDPSVPENTGSYPDQESWDFSFVISKNGNRSAEIRAGHLLKYEDEGLTRLGQRMKVDYYDKLGQHVSFLTSDSGIINEKLEHLTALGHVVMVSDSGYTMLTDKVFWRNDSNIVYTESDITLYSENDTLFGTGFRSDVKLENWTIDEPRGRTYREMRR